MSQYPGMDYLVEIMDKEAGIGSVLKGIGRSIGNITEKGRANSAAYVRRQGDKAHLADLAKKEQGLAADWGNNPNNPLNQTHLGNETASNLLKRQPNLHQEGTVYNNQLRSMMGEQKILNLMPTSQKNYILSQDRM